MRNPENVGTAFDFDFDFDREHERTSLHSPMFTLE
jgi:hypothetical protein